MKRSFRWIRPAYYRLKDERDALLLENQKIERIARNQALVINELMKTNVKLFRAVRNVHLLLLEQGARVEVIQVKQFEFLFMRTLQSASGENRLIEVFYYVDVLQQIGRLELLKKGPRLIIEEISVHFSHFRKGFGSLLLQEAVNAATRENLSLIVGYKKIAAEIYSQSLKPFFEANGFEAAHKKGALFIRKRIVTVKGNKVEKAPF